jgi:hypothetical protein
MNWYFAQLSLFAHKRDLNLAGKVDRLRTSIKGGKGVEIQKPFHL